MLICVYLWLHSLDASGVSAVVLFSLMELEFDKEIDALLRKARDSERVGKAAGEHLDADTVAAFTENSLPAGARMLYTQHLGDCSGCRKLLSQTISMNGAAVAQEPVAIAAPVAAALEPWYAGLFKLPKLALSMGALVVLFAGVLTVLVVQNRRSGSNGEVSQVTDSEQQRALPSTAGAPVMSNAAPMNSNPAVASNTNASTSTGIDTGTLSANTAANTSGFGAPAGAKPPEPFKEENKLALDAAKPQSQPEGSVMEKKSMIVAAPPPTPATTTGGAVPADEKKDAEERQQLGARRVETADKTKDRDDARYRANESPAPAAKSGPARMGPLQNQSNQINTNAGEMAVTRKVAGKTFTNKNGAWYDSSYGSQATKNYRRGTPEFQKLDAGLRSIAKDLGGTVIVVWKGTAYRID